MGWLEFFASIIGSLAWPGVVLVVLWYNRHRLAQLPDWLDELTLPGGAKIKFARALDKASVEADRLSSEVPELSREAHAEAARLSDLAAQFPEATVVHSFIKVIQTLGDMVPRKREWGTP